MLYVWVPAAQARLRHASPVASPPSAPLEMISSLQGALQIKAMFLIFFLKIIIASPQKDAHKTA
jgi:hypothetical protein